MLVDDRVTWGALSMLRGSDREPFTATDTALVDAVTAELAEGAVLLDRAAPSRWPARRPEGDAPARSPRG